MVIKCSVKVGVDAQWRGAIQDSGVGYGQGLKLVFYSNAEGYEYH